MKKLPKQPKISTSQLMDAPATLKQLEVLKSLGHYKKKYTKRQANEIISKQPASDRQISMLKAAGYNVLQGVTKGQFILAVLEIEANEKTT